MTSPVPTDFPVLQSAYASLTGLAPFGSVIHTVHSACSVCILITTVIERTAIERKATYCCDVLLFSNDFCNKIIHNIVLCCVALRCVSLRCDALRCDALR